MMGFTGLDLFEVTTFCLGFLGGDCGNLAVRMCLREETLSEKY